MSDNPVKDVLDELFPYFERMETQSAAVLQLLVEKRIVSNDELERYLGQASTASDIKWRAARVRMNRLMTPAVGEDKNKPGEAQTSEPSENNAQGTPENLATARGASRPTAEQSAPTAAWESGQSAASADDNPDSSKNKPEHRDSREGPNHATAESSNSPAEQPKGSKSAA